jgi:hypothetical protein
MQVGDAEQNDADDGGRLGRRASLGQSNVIAAECDHLDLGVMMSNYYI